MDNIKNSFVQEPMEKKNTTKVVARFSPLFGNNQGFFAYSGLEKTAEKSILTTVTGASFQLDAVEIATSQGDFFHRYVEPCVEKVLSGYNSSLLCYGYTGTGKTYTIFGREGDPGMAGHAMDFIMADSRVKTVTVQILEVYMEKIYDLLDGRSQSPVVQKTGLSGTVSIQVEDSAHLERIVANIDRKTKKNMVHDQSSRSHCIFIFRVETQDGSTKIGELYLVDLAGCERLADTEKIDGLTLQESKAINKSVFAINTVIKACAENNAHIPYRDSKITMLLQRAIGGNSFTVIVLCCSQANIAETITTLRFGQRCQRVSNEILPPIILAEPAAETFAASAFAESGRGDFPLLVSEVLCSDGCTRHEHECMENTIVALRLELKDLSSMLDEANKTILNSTSASAYYPQPCVAANNFKSEANDYGKEANYYGENKEPLEAHQPEKTPGGFYQEEETKSDPSVEQQDAGASTLFKYNLNENEEKAEPMEQNKNLDTREENVYMITLDKQKMQKLIEGIDKKDLSVVSVKQNRSIVKIKGMDSNKTLLNPEPPQSQPEATAGEKIVAAETKAVGAAETVVENNSESEEKNKKAAEGETKIETPNAREGLKLMETNVGIQTPEQIKFETTCSFCRCK